jgi:two-component system, chemotaxis family, CheB/CheR fusion protein
METEGKGSTVDSRSPRAAPAQGEGSPDLVVGVGASAGGLEAITALLKGLRADRLSLVVVQHLSPEHESALPALLARVAELPVVVASDGLKLKAGHVYVIPPNTGLAVLGGELKLVPAGAAQGRASIDYFFRSLASDLGRRAVGVVLSGTGSDGTEGLKAIKEAGGLTFAQEPQTAQYDGMPQAAVDSGAVDFVLSCPQIAEELMSLSRSPSLARDQPRVQVRDQVAKLIVMIRAAFGNDLSYYKPATIERRIERRMALHKVERLDDYVRLVASDAAELKALYGDVLIGVTSFFRDVTPFDELKKNVFPRMFERKKAGSPVRIWVPACSTGEEVYTIAICLLEHLDQRAHDYRIQIFGTDVEERAIQRARLGTYPAGIAEAVSPERLGRFFVKKHDGYQVARRVRDMVVFSVQDVTKDPPFSRLDLVSCRNLLIYLQPAMQKRVLRVLHYALNPEGVLLLGTSETVGDCADLFALTDRKAKLYTKKHAALVAPLELGLGSTAETPRGIQPGMGHRAAATISSLTDRKILELFGPPGVVVNEDLEVVHIRGRTGPYLEPTPGAPSFNILKLARPELHADLRQAIHQVRDKGTRVTADCRIHDGGVVRPLRLEVLPILDPETKARCVLVLFHEPEASPKPDESAALVPPSDATTRVDELERELKVTKEYLQSTIEELESNAEELKSSNEELQSANEELQSTNEELETSKEELQSSNEELTTVNDELQNRMGELQQTNDDLHNVLTGIVNVVVIVGMDLRIRRYTHAAERVLNLVAGDVGRSITMLNSFVTGQRVEGLVDRVIHQLAQVRTEVLCADGRWHELHINPYKTLDHTIKGAVLELVDIDDRKRSEAPPDVLAAQHPLAIVDSELKVLWVNARFSQWHRNALGSRLKDIGGLSDPELGRRLEAVLHGGAAFEDLKVGELRVSGSCLPILGNEPARLLVAFETDVAGAP